MVWIVCSSFSGFLNKSYHHNFRECSFVVTGLGSQSSNSVDKLVEPFHLSLHFDERPLTTLTKHWILPGDQGNKRSPSGRDKSNVPQQFMQQVLMYTIIYLEHVHSDRICFPNFLRWFKSKKQLRFHLSRFFCSQVVTTWKQIWQMKIKDEVPMLYLKFVNLINRTNRTVLVWFGLDVLKHGVGRAIFFCSCLFKSFCFPWNTEAIYTISIQKLFHQFQSSFAFSQVLIHSLTWVDLGCRPAHWWFASCWSWWPHLCFQRLDNVWNIKLVRGYDAMNHRLLGAAAWMNRQTTKRLGYSPCGKH